MISAAQNKKITQVGPGTPMGNVLRHYWYPVAATSEMENKYTKKVRLLGEDLVLFRDKSNNLGLVQERCPHRGVSLATGFPDEEGIRCPYHGWCFDNKGNCTDQPNEPETSTFKNRVKINAYEVQELGGLIWGYLGPKPAPLLPKFDGFVAENAIRMIGHATLPVNWVQVMENSLDPAHTEWLHGHFDNFVKEQRGEATSNAFIRHHKKIAFDTFEYGIVKRRLFEGQSEDSDDWKVGHPIVFPYILAVGGTGGEGSYAFQMRIPVDDHTTWHVWYQAYAQEPEVTIPEALKDVPLYEVPYLDENGDYLVDYIDGQDIMCWITQGPIADRTDEKLGTTDKGVILFRQMLNEQINKVERGEDPIGVIRDEAKNQFIELPLEKKKHHYSDGFGVITKRFQTRFSPIVEELIEFYEKEKVKM
ncbi:aromatic ring-hydroxylating dioxygenase subunit alpha [Halalkalibacterium ligniniphilum]|uniref:aromatic ring-hydroxylating dioxygenase subunit alpha n=1 Tax=Halalkalibacterium ligniniphilum TaxID=1134413 RepID=UPI0003469E62|nr:aromatic ring-hydroxylating dioxygenase subunit alpha [Halalkalibacterium ligniniphilum]